MSEFPSADGHRESSAQLGFYVDQIALGREFFEYLRVRAKREREAPHRCLDFVGKHFFKRIQVLLTHYEFRTHLAVPLWLRWLLQQIELASFMRGAYPTVAGVHLRVVIQMAALTCCKQIGVGTVRAVDAMRDRQNDLDFPRLDVAAIPFLAIFHMAVPPFAAPLVQPALAGALAPALSAHEANTGADLLPVWRIQMLAIGGYRHVNRSHAKMAAPTASKSLPSVTISEVPRSTSQPMTAAALYF